jgi:hypothetical protein
MTSHPPFYRGLTRGVRAALPALLMAAAACGDPPRIVGPSSLPAVFSLFPNSSPSDVATTVVVKGAGFKPGATVSIGGTATAVTFTNSSQIVATIPAHPVGVVDVIVTNPDGRSGSLTGGFRYYDLAATPLLVFTDPVSGFATSDLRDAQDQIVRINTAGDLLWMEDGRRFPGFIFDGQNVDAQRLCGCWFEIRFGTRNGERRAYVTGNFPHEGNYGTILDLMVSGGTLDWSFTDVPVDPGPYTLSGVVTQETPTGAVPLAGAKVSFLVGFVLRERLTDRDGVYQIP